MIFYKKMSMFYTLKCEIESSRLMPKCFQQLKDENSGTKRIMKIFSNYYKLLRGIQKFTVLLSSEKTRIEESMIRLAVNHHNLPMITI